MLFLLPKVQHVLVDKLTSHLSSKVWQNIDYMGETLRPFQVLTLGKWPRATSSEEEKHVKLQAGVEYSQLFEADIFFIFTRQPTWRGGG